MSQGFVNPTGPVTGAGAYVLQNQPTIEGAVNGTAPAAGQQGEVQFTQVLDASAISISSSGATNILSHTFPAGNWRVTGLGYIHNSGGGTATYFSAYATTTTGGSVDKSISSTNYNNSGTSIELGLPILTKYFYFSVPTTVYLVANCSTSGTVTASGYLQGERM